MRVQHTHTCLLSRCAGVALSIDVGPITITTGTVAAVTAAASPLLVAVAVPLWRMLTAVSVRAHGTPAETQGGSFCREMGILSLGDA